MSKIRTGVQVFFGIALAFLTIFFADVYGIPTSKRALAQGNTERGQYLIRVAGCADCHSAYTLAGTPLAGGNEFNLGPLGVYYSANLTLFQEWNLEGFDKAVRRGISASGRTLAPAMPYEFYQGMSDEDVAALFAYLQSLTPVKNDVPAAKPGAAAASLQPLPEAKVSMPKIDDSAEYGRYLVENVAHCGLCHSPRNEQGQIVKGKELAGGGYNLGTNDMPLFGSPILGSVLTASGYTLDTFKATLRTGVRPWGADLPVQMPWRSYAVMSDSDIAAVWNYLQTKKLDSPWPVPGN